MWNQNIWQDSVSSVMVPPGYTLEIFKNDSFSGDSTRIEGPTWQLPNMELACIPVPNGFEDVNSSAKVYRTTLGKYSYGDWVSITATENIDFTYHEGFSTTKTEEHTETE